MLISGPSRVLLAPALALLALCGCGSSESETEVLNSRAVTFPNGTKIRAEVMIQPQELMRGMKYRDSLAANRGMLFVHPQEGNYPYWMYEVKIPLDMVWMDRNRSIVQIVHNVPPCPGPKEKCLNYGGQFSASYVLEVNAGVVKKEGLKPGMVLDF